MQKLVLPDRIELPTLRLLFSDLDYETYALPTELQEHFTVQSFCFINIR